MQKQKAKKRSDSINTENEQQFAAIIATVFIISVGTGAITFHIYSLESQSDNNKENMNTGPTEMEMNKKCLLFPINTHKLQNKIRKAFLIPYTENDLAEKKKRKK